MARVCMCLHLTGCLLWLLTVVAYCGLLGPYSGVGFSTPQTLSGRQRMLGMCWAQSETNSVTHPAPWLITP